MSKAKNRALLAAVLSMIACAASSHAQTIDELTEAARAKKLHELRKDAAPAPAAMPGAPVGAPPPPAMLPAVAPASAMSGEAASAVPVRRKRTVQSEPYLLAIYGVGSRLVAEIAEDNADAKYKAGDKTDGGWTVAAIHKREVVLQKAAKDGKVKTTKTLSFWTPVDDKEPAEVDKSVQRFNGTGGPAALVNPPFPPGTFGR